MCTISSIITSWMIILFQQIEKVQMEKGQRETKLILKTKDCYASRLKKLNLLSLEKGWLLTE